MKKPTKRSHHKNTTLVLDVAGECLSEARWSSRTKELAVTFTRTGEQYVYYDVPKSVAKQLDGGEAFNELIRGQYDYS